MNCGEFEIAVGDLARGRGLDESGRQAAAAHARDCVRCGARLVDEWELARLLGVLAAGTAGQAAPQRVEAALLAEFDRRHASHAVRRPKFARPAWAYAAAAVAVLGVAGTLWTLRPRPVVTPLAVPRAAALPAPVAAAVKPAPKPVVARAIPPRHKRAPRRETPVRTFFPLTPVYAAAEIQDGPIVRIGMPRRALRSFGWYVDPDNLEGHIEAEVVLDNDTGMAQAIRFVDTRH